MALKKEFTTKQGFTADYWKVDMITIDKNRYEASFSLNLYASKEKAQELDTFIESRCITLYQNIDNELLDDLSSTDTIRKERFNKYFDSESEYQNTYNACYECAKELDEYFTDAENC